ncbi:hypothetical protein ACFQYP_27670 [Nonomuraea antimicrobica]
MSSSTARAPVRNVRATARWTSTMVGLVSPDPINTSTPGMSSAFLSPRLDYNPARHGVSRAWSICVWNAPA